MEKLQIQDHFSPHHPNWATDFMQGSYTLKLHCVYIVAENMAKSFQTVLKSQDPYDVQGVAVK